jgi:pyruvate dehydrogenase E2 component (dihydrolipoamide acetyltransferase)
MNILMPQLGETVAEGKIVKWFKRPGDEVKPGENLFEIETDKTSMEVPSTVAGTLTAVNFQVGQVAKVGTVVAVIGGDADPAQNAQRAMPVDVTPASPQTPLIPAPGPGPRPARGQATAGVQKELDSRFRGGERGDGYAYPNMHPFREVRTPEKNHGPAKIGGRQVTPLARRLAGERGIDLASIKGSGPHGRIVASDIATARASQPSAGMSAAQVKALYQHAAYEEVLLDTMRATIARRLTEAKSTVPHFYLTADIDAGRLLAIRGEVNASLPNVGEEGSLNLSLNDFIIKAWAAALQRVPAANAVWAGDRILRFKSSDIGVAVALEDGLVTPVIRGAQAKSLTAISAEVRDLAARARDRKLKPDEYQGGASAISNLGMHGVREFSAIINPPQASILAVGAVHRAPVEADNGSVTFTSRITVTLSCDHRVIDGALGARLLAAFKGFVENPVTALV